jgi:deoxyribodipyrimidine photolyase
MVIFCLTDKYPEAYERHYAFMLEGLAEVARNLHERGIKFVCVHGAPPHPIISAAIHASCIIVDCGYTRVLRLWRKVLAEQASVAVIEVEGEVVVPAKLLADKHDSFAATFRPRISARINEFLHDVEQQQLQTPSNNLDPFEVISKDAVIYDLLQDGVEHALASLDINRSVPRVSAGGGGGGEALRGGTSEALRHLDVFFSNCASSPCCSAATPAATPTRGGGWEGETVPGASPRVSAPAASKACQQLVKHVSSVDATEKKGGKCEERPIENYAVKRNHPALRKQSHLSPYLHFGHISVVAVGVAARVLMTRHTHLRKDLDVFWEELVVRCLSLPLTLLTLPVKYKSTNTDAHLRKGLHVFWEELVVRYSVYLLYQHFSTKTDAESAAGACRSVCSQIFTTPRLDSLVQRYRY